jgi:LmbE family N-acetylglucosaminyl deacetylase
MTTTTRTAPRTARRTAPLDPRPATGAAFDALAGPLRVASVAALGPTLSIWAHPDDETYLAGGLMAALRQAGMRVVCVTATDGEGGELDGATSAPETVRPVRRRELRAAMAALGVSEHRSLGWPDGGCAQVDPAAAIDRIAELLVEVRPQTVLTFGPDGFTGHPDHRAVAGWVTAAVAAAGEPAPRLLQAVTASDVRERSRDIDERFGIHTLGAPPVLPDDALAVRLDLDGALLERKLRALAAHHSQTAVLRSLLGERRFAAWVRTECFAQPLDARPDHP